MPSPKERKNSHFRQENKSNLIQGDLLRGLNFNYTASLDGKDLSLGYPFPYAVILSQSCDLEQHYGQLKKNVDAKKTNAETVPSYDKILDTVLICPAFPHESFLAGTHIGERKMFDFDGPTGQAKAYKKLVSNDSYNRYHYLPALEGVSPELVIDFKKFHTVPIEIVEENYSSTYLASLIELYRERLSQRFSNYLSRIGLPEDRAQV